MLAERALHAFWPLISVVLLSLAALMFGVHQTIPLEVTWIGSVLAVLAAVAGLVAGIRKFRWPTRAEALNRLDQTLPGRPISAIMDQQAIGAGDEASEQVWQAHLTRMAERTAAARPVKPDMQVARRDPYALRYLAMLAFVMALIFGSVWRVATVSEIATGGGAAAATGPSWEGWVEPPTYTGKPSIYLADVKGKTLIVPHGSRITLRLYGEIGDLTVAETISGRVNDIESAAEPSQSFEAVQNGTLSIEGPGGQSWTVDVTPDLPPTIELSGDIERGARGELRQTFEVKDDYGVTEGRVEFALDLTAVDRRYGLVVDPEPRDTIVLDLPMPFVGDRTEFLETLSDNLSEHPWAGLPVTLTMYAEDAAGNVGSTAPETVTLPGRRFFDPLAGALVEQRRDLLWSRSNGPRIAQVLRAVSYQPDEVFRSETAYLMLRVAIRRLEMATQYGTLTDEIVQEIAQALWDIAVLIEDGSLSDAAERLRQAQERLEEAMRNGATDEEIAELMDELRDAMQDYMQQLAEQAQENNDFAENQNTQQITGDQLQDMLDRLQELMEQGRMEEAQQLMDQLRRMMENMQVTQGQQGQGQQSPGQQAMEGLADTLRQQQGLNDDTFSDLQEQFGEQGQDGQQGQPGQQGQNGQQQGGQGQQGQGGQQQGQGGQPQPGQGQGQQPGNSQGQSLADRQQALRDLLNQQQRNLPGRGTPGGDAAQESLDRAGRAMDGAEDSLRENDYAGALDQQSEALEALRDGMRELAQEMAQQQQQQQGQQGEAFGQNNSQGQRDPLGRDNAANGRIGTDDSLLQGEDVYRRAQELLDEIRRRSSDTARPDVELDYLKRLLDRF